MRGGGGDFESTDLLYADQLKAGVLLGRYRSIYMQSVQWDGEPLSTNSVVGNA